MESSDIASHNFEDTSHKFTYNGWKRVFIVLGRICISASLALFTGMAGFLFYWATILEGSSPFNPLQDGRVTLICVGLWILIIPWWVGITILNAWPTIWVEKDALWISAFVLFRIRIEWGDITDIGALKLPLGAGILVRARKISPFHYAYGWLYSKHWAPGFLIGYDIDDYDHLISQIRTRAFNRRIILS